MGTIQVEVWLYGPMARYAGAQSQGSYAQLNLELPEGSTMAALLEELQLPVDERGITFVNGDLAALPGLDVDRDLVLHDGDRVGIFQYRFGASTTPQIQDTFQKRTDGGLRHAYTQPDE
jgi:sulfur carrier protein ThiS